MHPVHLADMSKAVLSKLRNGHAVRAMLGAKGHGVGAILGEDNLKKLLKAGKRGAKAVIKLGAEELHANRAGGTGIMAGGKFSFKHAAKSVNKGFKKVAGNPIVQDVVSQTAGDLAAAAAPELGPLGYAGAAYGAKKGMQAYSGSGFVAGGALGHPEHVGGKIKMKKIGKTIKHIANNKNVQSVAKKAAEAAIEAAMASGGEGFVAGGKFKIPKGARMIHHDSVTMPISEVERLGLPTGRVDGGKLKMKKIGKTIKHIANNKNVQSVAKKAAEAAIEAAMASGGEGFVAGGKIDPRKLAGEGFNFHHLHHSGAVPVEGTAYMHSMLDGQGGKIKMKKIGKTIGKIAKNKNVQSVAKKAAEAAIDAAMASGGEGLYAGRGLYASGGSAKRKVIDLIEDIGENRPRKSGESRVRQAIDLVESKLRARGGAIGPQMGRSGITNVGAGGSLLCMRNPALRPQADSENFFFHTEFPPALAERMEGSGIYA